MAQQPAKKLKNDIQDSRGNTDLHKYAALGDLDKFEILFEKLKQDNANDYLEILSKYNNRKETALSVAISEGKFDIAIYLLQQLDDTEKEYQIDRIISIDSVKLDKFLEYEQSKNIISGNKFLSHKASELKRNRHGGDYQSKLLMLFAHEGIESNDQFRLGTEVSEAGKFDDLVFRYTDPNGNYRYIYLQAKHEQHLGENPLTITQFTNSKHKYHLGKYFIDYSKTELLKYLDQIEHLFLCTNNRFSENDDPKNIYFQEISDKRKYCKYFSDIGGKWYRFSCKDDNEKNDLFKKLFRRNFEPTKKNEIEKLLKKFVLAVEQPSSAELSGKIKSMMGSDTYNYFSFSKFKEFIDEWFASRNPNNTARFILHSEIREFWSDFKSNICGIKLGGSVPLFREKIDKFTRNKLTFNDTSSDVLKIEDFLNSKSDDILRLVYAEEDSFLSIAKINQILDKMFQEDPTKYTVSDLRSLTSLNRDGEIVLNAFKSQNKHLLAIDCNSVDDEGEQLLDTLYSELWENKSCAGKQIILIVSVLSNKAVSRQYPGLSMITLYMENGPKNLNPASKNQILQTDISLFGTQLKLSRLTEKGSNSDELFEILDGNSLTSLIKNDSIVIGSGHQYDFDTFIDIPRTLTYQTKLDSKCILENTTDLFAISGISKSDLSDLIPKNEKVRDFGDESSERDTRPIRFICFQNCTNIENDFEQLCSDYSQYTIHLVENMGNELEWKKSHGSLRNLRRFVIKEGNDSKLIEDITDSAIIAGDPGIGKSTILTSHAIKTDCLWSIRVNLKEYERHINEVNFGSLEEIFDFLSNVIDPKYSQTCLIKDLLRFCSKQKGQVTILLDGYDEIQDRYKGKVVQMVKILRLTQGKVWITTRSYAQRGIEDALGTFSYSLNAFEGREQKDFLSKFWISRLNSKVGTEKIDEFSKDLLQQFHKLNLMKKQGLIGVVLQARMVAEMFQDACRKHLESEEKLELYDLGISSIFDLYRKFVEYQFKRYFEEKLKNSNNITEVMQDSSSSSYTETYEKLAIKLLFTKDQIGKKLITGGFSVEKIHDVGLTKTTTDGTVGFVHPTYAEYFAANMFVSALEKKDYRSEYKNMHHFLLFQIFRDRNSMILEFMTQKIQSEHNTVLHSNWETLQDCDLLEGDDIRAEIEIQLESVNDASAPKKSLSELQHSVKENIGRSNRSFGFFDLDKSLITQLVEKFLLVTDSESLEITFAFILEINEISRHIVREYIGAVVKHYYSTLKEQNRLPSTLRDNCIKHLFSDEKLQHRLMNLEDSFEEVKMDQQQLAELINWVIPNDSDKIKINEIINLDRLCFFFNIFHPTIIQNIKLLFHSMEVEALREYAKTILQFLKTSVTLIDADKLKYETLSSLRSLADDVLFYRDITSETESFINDVDNFEVGVCLARFLEIITPRMFDNLFIQFSREEKFNSKNVEALILYILSKPKVKFPRVNELAFLKMLVLLFKSNWKRFTFSREQLETTLDVVDCVIEEHGQYETTVSDYLQVLVKLELKIINSENTLIVLDPASEFYYELQKDNNSKYHSLNILQQKIHFNIICRKTPELPPINRFFTAFSLARDIAVLNNALEFFSEATLSQYSILLFQSYMTIEKNIAKAVRHYYDRLKKQTLEKPKLKNKRIKHHFRNEMLQETLNNFKGLREDEILNLIIPSNIETLEHLKDLDILCYFFNIFHPTVMQKVKLHICSTVEARKKYATKIIHSLETSFASGEKIMNDKLGHEDLKSLAAFYVDIVFHPSISMETEIAVNEIYQNKSIDWLGGNGALTCRILEIVNHRMSGMFDSVLNIYNNQLENYQSNIFEGLICYILGKWAVDKLPRVEKRAFFQILVDFVDLGMKITGKFPFTCVQIETTLDIVKCTEIEGEQYAFAVSDYLLILKRAGLEIVYTETNFSVIAPEAEFKYEFPEECMQQMRKALDLTNHNLGELQQNIELKTVWRRKSFWYDGDSSLINNFVSTFSKETDVIVLRYTLKCFLKPLFYLTYQKFEKKLHELIKHYFLQLKGQHRLQSELKDSCLKYLFHRDEKLQLILINIGDSPVESVEEQQQLNKLMEFMMPSKIERIDVLQCQNRLCFFLDLFHPTILEMIKSRIYSTVETVNEYGKQIIQFLESVVYLKIYNEKQAHWDFISWRSFFVDILFDPSFNNYTDAFFDDIFRNKSADWLKSKGVLISKIFESVTPKMAEIFNSGLYSAGVRVDIYQSTIFEGVICYMLKKFSVKELPRVDKPAFFQMLVIFTDFDMKIKAKFPFTHEEVGITLNILKSIVKEKQYATVVANYLLILRSAGFDLNYDETRFLISNTEKDFHYEFPINCMEQVIEKLNTANHSLRKLQQNIESKIVWRNKYFTHAGNSSLIREFFKEFLKVTDITALKDTLEYFLNPLFYETYETFRTNIHEAIKHYCSQLKEQANLRSELRVNCIKYFFSGDNEMQETLHNLEDFCEKNKIEQQQLKQFSDLLNPNKIENLDGLRGQDCLCYFLDIFHPTAIKKIKSHISSSVETVKEYGNNIIKFFESSKGHMEILCEATSKHDNFVSWRSFYIDIFFDPRVSTETEAAIDENYNDKSLCWLESRGVLIARILEIVTPKMSEIFNSILTCNNYLDEDIEDYQSNISKGLICYMLTKLTGTELPRVNKLAFLQLIVNFVSLDKINCFPRDQIVTALELVKCVVEKHGLDEPAVLHYLSMLRKTGLKVDLTKNTLMMQDPTKNFECILPIDLGENADNPYFNRKRKESEGDSENVKRPKI
ncbi:uncharacterized protein LOC129720780 [Wyeomyia smithii]|uniref:uncharacterized protein LOC129720780 n=1 Tax=Wyeomyia smithii TaxID=174621 RepID=UPI002467FE9E|nr:uncharacterized protein LOC129720780 [Wyeomyia smithii]XP_055528491.1 uncharacterized protein LOC129720780 [Wyeomyia smithii]XP_055528492.1 uncharacterized protein LOC129720780 [Wyeomyia smithii]XP_055528493.1 uncharacterized protein LOC129720780 [Wyeomyia smithii]XP_055528494.1 uncharacterized protein LOC129720780 [Wyeomyia smithii]